MVTFIKKANSTRDEYSEQKTAEQQNTTKEKTLKPANQGPPLICDTTKGIGVKDSNEAEVSAIFRVLRIFSRLFHDRSIVVSDSRNVISWVISNQAKPWKL